jgi:hypothetical protein
MKKKYESPDIEIEEFIVEDIIADSTNNNGFDMDQLNIS